MRCFVAVDLGATSGRVVNVQLDSSSMMLDVVRRFPTVAIPGPGGELVWDVDLLLDEVRLGLVEAARRCPGESVAVDSWGVDYGLFDVDGHRLGPVHAYRSHRTEGVMDAVCSQLGRERIYAVSGIQFLPFNTIFQLVAAKEDADYLGAHRLLMVPDVINRALCGSGTNDVTNASTTQLLDAGTREWNDGLVADLGLRRDLLPELHHPGTPLGAVRGVGHGVDGLTVVAAASHDTASAVVGTPLALESGDIYISCGTWSLVGCELSAPVTSAAALRANVTNEVGVDGTVRLLKNVTGLWLLEECRRVWSAKGVDTEVSRLVGAAAEVAGGRSVVDPDDPCFAAPGDMPSAIAAWCRATGQPEPRSPAEITRVILDSLALAWRQTVGVIEAVAGIHAERIHLVGGGSAVGLLRVLCASACERPVLAGPVEATVVGNAIVQAIAAGALGSIGEGRGLVRRILAVDEVTPRRTLDWDALASRLAAGRVDR